MMRRIAGGAGAALLLALAAGAVWKAYGPGTAAQRLSTARQRWLPFIGPDAGAIWRFIAGGVALTLEAAVISVVLSLVFGLILALARLARHPLLGPALPAPVRRLISAPATLLVQTVRSSPLFMLVGYSFIAAPRLGLNLPALAAGILALTLYTSCVLAEIWRAGILSLEHGQLEAAASLGLKWPATMRVVVLPQAARRMVPAVVSQLITLIKDTSLLSTITVIELSRRVALLQERYFNPIEAFVVAGALYFVLNWSLSLSARRLERRPGTVSTLG